MHAVLVGNQGKLVWSPVPDPVLKDDDVLLEIHAAALNRADLLQRAGQYPPPEGWPEWFGLEAAGIIRALGPKAEAEGKWHVGDAVCALLGGGGALYYFKVMKPKQAAKGSTDLEDFDFDEYEDEPQNEDKADENQEDKE